MKPIDQFRSLNPGLRLALFLFGCASWVTVASEFKPAFAQLVLDCDRVTPGSTLQATYTFRSGGPAPEPCTVFVHVVRPDGRHLGADFNPNPPTTAWPPQGLVRQGPFPIVLPADAEPGRYQVWVGLFSAASGARFELDNADLEHGTREYQVGEFEVLPAGVTASPQPATFRWLPGEDFLTPSTPLPAVASGGPMLQRLALAVDRKVLNPLRRGQASTRWTLTGFFSDGSKRSLRPAEAVLTARTRHASGSVEVIAVDGRRVRAREGGVATLEATVAQGDQRLTAATQVVVAPFYRDYHQTLVLKLFLGMEGQPVERLAQEPLFQKPHDVLCTFAEALEVIRQTDHLTRGIPKIIYLVGWQKGGHDHQYPSWAEVNPRLKRPQDADALQSLRWLIRAARAYHTTVSLHLNMVDAYRHSPLFAEYAAKDLFARDADGQLLSPGIQIQGDDMYNVVYPREWEAGLAQRRIDQLIRMVPELKDGHTIHVDVFIAQRDHGRPISPWHAKPENGGLTPARYVETQRKIFHYWRARGFDVTGEGIFWAHPPGEGFTGLQPMSWWYPADPHYQMQIPEVLMARGRTHREGDGDFRFGSSMHGEELYQKDKDTLAGFLGMFCRTTLPWFYLSRRERIAFDGQVLTYSGGVTAGTEAGRNLIRQGEFVLRDHDDLFVPALWLKREIIAYSRHGYADRSWRLPADWNRVREADLYRITRDGAALRQARVAVRESRLVLSLAPDEAVSVVPAGTRRPGKATRAR